MKKLFSLIAMQVVAILSFVFGVGNMLWLADASALPDGGNYESGATGGETTGADGTGTQGTPVQAGNDVVGHPNGIASETIGRANADDDFYLNDVDKRIVKIRPISTPIDQISRYAKQDSASSFVCKYYSSGTRPVTTLTSTTIAKQTKGASVLLEVEDPDMFTLDDTILVPSIKAITNKDGVAYEQNALNTPYLELCVCGRDASTNNPIVYAVNGYKQNGTGEPIWLPQIPADTKIIRMAKSGGELDVQTGRFATRPTAEINYCQNFMIQVEQSTLDKIAAKEVNWEFSDLEEDGIYDMRLTQEFSYLFGDSACIHHVSKDKMAQWFTKGIWFMAGKDLEISVDKEGKVTEDSLVDFSKDVFDGIDSGNARVLLAGSELMSALDKIKTDKVIQKTDYTKWHLDFTELKTTFGKLRVLHCQLFNLVGKSDEGFLFDPEYLTKKVHLSWSRSMLDLKKAGVRNTDAVVIQEIACLCLRNAKAHARVKLGKPAAAGSGSKPSGSQTQGGGSSSGGTSTTPPQVDEP